MSYFIDPLNEEELNSFGVAEPGIYNFEVLSSKRKSSKSGNPMAELNIRFWDTEGKPLTLYDYLVFSKVNLNIRKVKHFCDATGLSKDYERGEVPEELAGLSGKFEIAIQDEQAKPMGGFYPKKNIVIDYVKADVKDSIGPGTVRANTNDFQDDKDIPF